MGLIPRKRLRQRFRKLVRKAEKVDVAVAWAKPCDAVEALVEGAEAGKRIRVAVGLSFNGTNPATLRRLHGSVELRIASPPRGIFHPKYFCFRNRHRTICWVGSTNLTAGGFGGNVELVHEFEDDTRESQRWFKALWDTLDPNPEAAIARYERDYDPASPAPQNFRPPQYRGDAPEFAPLSPGATWDDFVDGLHARNRYRHDLVDGGYDLHEKWDVLDDRRSYLHTILTGREVVRLPEDRWQDLTNLECDILCGRSTEEGEWGLLGTLTPAGRVAHVFNPNAMPDVGTTRTQLREQVQHMLPTDIDNDTLAQNAGTAAQAIMRIDGFGPAAATRPLTLARPDRLVSVNRQSAAGLAALSGLHLNPTDLANNPAARKSWVRDSYADLLRWVHAQPWFNAPEPDEPLERLIWNFRAALLDAFVYPPINPNQD